MNVNISGGSVPILIGEPGCPPTTVKWVMRTMAPTPIAATPLLRIFGWTEFSAAASVTNPSYAVPAPPIPPAGEPWLANAADAPGDEEWSASGRR